MDPLKVIPAEVSDYILQHFTTAELLTATEVSRTWNHVIGSSFLAMQKFKLSMFWLRNTRFLSKNAKETLVESERRYQNIDFKYHSCHIDDIRDILEANNRQWKSVKLERLNFNSTHHIIEFLKLIEESAIELEMHDIYVASLTESDYNNFKRLKKLKLKYIESRALLEKAFVKCKNLREFSLISNDSNFQSFEALRKIMLQNSNLETLQLSSQLFTETFTTETIAEISFKLKSFKTKDHYRASIGANYAAFLQTQMKTLEELSTDVITCGEALKVISHMPKLRNLNIGNVNFLDTPWNSLQLHVNQSIEILSYHDAENKMNIMKSIILSTPNVRELKIYSMTQEMMEFLSANTPKLEKLTLRTIDATDLACRDLFPNLKAAQIEILTSDFEDHLEGITEENRNPFVKLILASSYIMLH